MNNNKFKVGGRYLTEDGFGAMIDRVDYSKENPYEGRVFCDNDVVYTAWGFDGSVDGTDTHKLIYPRDGESTEDTRSAEHPDFKQIKESLYSGWFNRGGTVFYHPLHDSMGWEYAYVISEKNRYNVYERSGKGLMSSGDINRVAEFIAMRFW